MYTRQEFSCYTPTKIFFGVGCLNKVVEICNQLGKNILVVTDKNLRSLGLVDKLCKLLDDACLDYEVIDEVVENPIAQTIDNLKTTLEEKRFQLVVAIGGGSVIDSAKGIALLLKNPLKCWDYCIKSDYKLPELKSKPLPIISIPTTAGTGSEVTPFALFTNKITKVKSAMVFEEIFPKVAIIDPELMLSLPSKITAYTGIDALSHALEAYININSTIFSEMLSMKATKLIASNLRKAVSDGENIEARENMAWASTLAGIAITHSSTTLAHAIGQSIGGITNAPHGATMAAALPEVMNYAVPNIPEKFAIIAEMFDESIKYLPIYKKAKKSVSLVRELICDVGANVRFREFGLDEVGLEEAVQIAMDTLKCNIEVYPRKVSKEDIINIYKKCI